MIPVRQVFLTFLILLVSSQSLRAQPPQVKPELVSVSSSQLSLMDNVIQEAINQHKLPGAVVLVSRKGKVVWKSIRGAGD